MIDKIIKEIQKMSKAIYILGTTGTGEQTLCLYKDLGKFKVVAGFIKENCRRKDLKIQGIPVMDASIIDTLPRDSVFIGAMGSPKRKRWIEEIEAKGFDFDTLVHPSVIKDKSLSMGKGCIIYPGVIITSHVEMKRHSIININSTIGHNSKIGNFVTICPGVNIGGYVTIGDECWIGIGATIIHNVAIGKGSYIGAGSVVTKDIPENVLAFGVPAKPVRELKKSDWKKMV